MVFGPCEIVGQSLRMMGLLYDQMYFFGPLKLTKVIKKSCLKLSRFSYIRIKTVAVLEFFKRESTKINLLNLIVILIKLIDYQV